MINIDRNNNMYDYILTSNHYSGDVETIYFIKGTDAGLPLGK